MDFEVELTGFINGLDMGYTWKGGTVTYEIDWYILIQKVVYDTLSGEIKEICEECVQMAHFYKKKYWKDRYQVFLSKTGHISQIHSLFT
jgi:hypothetical protein